MLYFFAFIGIFFIVYVLWNSVFPPMVLSIKYSNAAWKLFRDNNWSWWKCARVMPRIFFYKWLDFSCGAGSYITGGKLGRHPWGSWEKDSLEKWEKPE